ncbi:hypothetical protein Y023_5906 [Burkholderia pseudomallei A79D]|nr:hypothetical protein Y023_5906 [Burkholderia pseudomallei A79D]KGX94721.1 hypothetical protein X997_5755 [Burkholderia pseudomallei A79C]
MSFWFRERERMVLCRSATAAWGRMLVYRLERAVAQAGIP